MMKTLFLTMVVLITGMVAATAQNQTQYMISGKLIDGETKEAISLANVRILNRSDSAFVAGKASDSKGLFFIPVPIGSYIVHISFIGYNDLYKNVRVTVSSKDVKLGDISLQSDAILLSETVVTAKAPEITVKGDTLEFNADSYKVTESAVLEELLKKMPGVEVSREGKITVNGKEITKILVDGEEFFSDDPQVASKNLPAKMVDKLQVLERKSEMSRMTGFDDGEEENVINLTVRPGMKEGLFGNAFAGYGSKQRYEANAMANYMKDSDQYTFISGINNTNNAGFSDLASSMFGSMGGGRGMRGRGFGGNDGVAFSGMGGGNFSKKFSPSFKLGGNANYGYTDREVLSDIFTQNILSKGNTLENEHNRSNNKSQNMRTELRMEWAPDTSTLIIFRPNVSFYRNTRLGKGDFATTKELEADTINHGNSDYFSEGNGKNLSGQLEISRHFGKAGRVLSGELRGEKGDSQNSGANLSNTFYNGTKPDDLIDQKFTNRSAGSSWRGYLSYVEPIGKRMFLQLAYQYQQNMSKSNKDTRSKDADGNYTVLDTAYSKRLENNFVRQRLELNLKGVGEKFDYTFGVSMQPALSRSKTFVDTKLLHDARQSVINYAPMAQLNYKWNRNKNLRLRYFGRTNQPSVQQLSPVVDVSNPLNISYGNPDLKPSFSHRMFFRYQNSNPEKASSFAAFLNGSTVTNDIVSSTVTDAQTGRKETTYKNVSGNWSADGRVMLNLPLKNIKFSVFSISYAGYNHSNGFSNNEKNTNRRTNLSESLGLNYRSDLFDFSIRGSVNFNNVTNSLKGEANQQFLNYGGSANTSIYLPWDLTIESDIRYATNSGYADGFQQNEWLWNASIQKQLFKQKNGTLRFKIYDILQQRSNINRSVTSNYIRDTTTNTLTSYFMVHFVYRFNFFKGGITMDDMMPRRDGHGHGPGGHGGPGGGARF